MKCKFWAGSVLAVSATLLVGLAQATMPGEVVADFKLVDHTGKTRSLYERNSTKPIVLMIQGNYCPIVRHAMPALREVSDRYTTQGVRFLLLNSNIQDNRETIAKEVEEFGYTFPVLVDTKQKIGEALVVQRTSEVFVVDPKTRKLIYRGPMDDRLSYERQRPATKHYLIDALDAALAGQPVKVPYADGVGCIVNFPNRRTTQVDHSKMAH
jgi:peroxiredoxin